MARAAMPAVLRSCQADTSRRPRRPSLGRVGRSHSRWSVRVGAVVARLPQVHCLAESCRADTIRRRCTSSRDQAVRCCSHPPESPERRLRAARERWPDRQWAGPYPADTIPRLRTSTLAPAAPLRNRMKAPARPPWGLIRRSGAACPADTSLRRRTPSQVLASRWYIHQMAIRTLRLLRYLHL